MWILKLISAKSAIDKGREIYKRGKALYERWKPFWKAVREAYKNVKNTVPAQSKAADTAPLPSVSSAGEGGDGKNSGENI